MNNNHHNLYINANAAIEDYFIDERSYYLQRFNKLPNVIYIGSVDGEKIFQALQRTMQNDIVNILERKWFHHKKKKLMFDRVVLELKDQIVIKLNENYAFILHDNMATAHLNTLQSLIIKHKRRQRKDPKEINLIVKGQNGLELKSMEIKKSKLNTDLFYNDDFVATDRIIQSRLKNKNDKGIVLLHGLPGTGKTTYLRHLVGKLNKRILFLSPSIAGDLMSPELIELLIDNPNSILIVEDAENIIMDRRYNSSSSVSTLLNISDGLLSDFLNVQLICTFNSELTHIDDALMRKGRLIARYEFGKLSIEKAKRLAAHLKMNISVTEPMTLSEITNANSVGNKSKPVNRIGFKRLDELLEMQKEEVFKI